MGWILPSRRTEIHAAQLTFAGNPDTIVVKDDFIVSLLVGFTGNEDSVEGLIGEALILDDNNTFSSDDATVGNFASRSRTGGNVGIGIPDMPTAEEDAVFTQESLQDDVQNALQGSLTEKERHLMTYDSVTATAALLRRFELRALQILPTLGHSQLLNGEQCIHGVSIETTTAGTITASKPHVVPLEESLLLLRCSLDHNVPFARQTNHFHIQKYVASAKCRVGTMS